MNEVDIIELEAVSVRFYSPEDEAAFFEWLRRISCVTEIFGSGRSIKFRINTVLVDEAGVRELLSLHRRYDIDMDQLIIFDMQKFAGWFRDSRAYWHKSIFP